MAGDAGDGGGGEVVWDPVGLAPAAFDEDPAAVAFDPVVFVPMLLAAVGRLFPAAGSPLVAVAVPVLVALDPDVAAAGGGGTTLHLSAGRADADHDLGIGGDGEAGGDDQGGEEGFHHAFWCA